MTNQSNDRSNDTRRLLPQLQIEKDSFRILLITILSFLLAVLFFLEIVVWYTGDSLYVLFLTGLPVLIVTVGFLLVGIKNIVQGHYKSALLMILPIPFLIFAFSFPSMLFTVALKDQDHFGFAHDIAYYTKFTLHEKQYLDAIKLIQPDNKGFRYTKFLWSGKWEEGTQLVYDESDEIAALHPEGFAQCPYIVNKLKQHFYVIRITCG